MGTPWWTVCTTNVTVTKVDSVGTMWTQTNTAVFSVVNLPLTERTEDYLAYTVNGPDLCSHITHLDMSAQYPSGSWQLQSHACIESSEIIVSLGPDTAVLRRWEGEASGLSRK